MAWTEPRTWVTGELVTSAIMNTHVRDNFLALLPIGTYLYRLGSYGANEQTLNSMWLQCNGFAVSRTTYAALDTFLAGLTPARPFGAGNGSTTVNLPDMQGRVPVSAGGALALGANDGVTLANRRPQHRHTPHNHLIYNLIDAAAGSGNAGSVEWEGGYTSSSSVDGGSGNTNDALDAPAHLVGGVWWIKYREV